MKYNIYKLLDPDTLEVKYVGQTTKPIIQRLAGHLYDAYNRTRFQIDKQNWIKTLMLEYKMPVIELIEETNDIKREKYWIKLLNPPYNIIYNTSEAYAKFKKTFKSIPIYQYDLDGNFIKEWSSASEVQFTLGIESSNIAYAANNKRRMAGDFVWRYYKQEKVDVAEKRVYTKEVHKYTLEGLYLESYRCARDLDGFKYKVISKCCRGVNKKYNGFRFSFEKKENLGPLLKQKRKKNEL